MKILLAEDNAVTRRMIEAVLTAPGHDVHAVADGAEAVAAYERMRSPLVILDWEMPAMDGLEACRRIRTTAGGDGVFVLMLTGRHEPDDLGTALGAGVDDYLVKPVAPAQLEARLVIAQRRIAQDEARRAAEAALAEARWLAGVGETALALQHEINNPLTALLGEGQLLELDASLPSSASRSVTSMLTAARRIADVVRRLAELKEAHSVEYARGARMLDLAPPVRGAAGD